jgi:hypothetical protein
MLKGVKESVQSVLEQTYQDWEIIIGVNGYTLNSDVFTPFLI